MNLFLSNIIPRLKQYSQTLDRLELFVDFPWIVIGEDQIQQKYIFRRNGQLLISLQGNITEGRWEYLSAAKSLVIHQEPNPILLNQNFIDPVVMVLAKDGVQGKNLFLVNENLLPDLNVDDYLKSIYYERNNIEVRRSDTGVYLEINNYQGWINGNSVTIEGAPVPDGIFQLESSEKKFVIKDSRIVKVLVYQTYETNKGRIVVEQQEYMGPLSGDLVFQNDVPAVDGRYRLGFMDYLIVKDGRIFRS